MTSDSWPHSMYLSIIPPTGEMTLNVYLVKGKPRANDYQVGQTYNNEANSVAAWGQI